ncbi:MAG TPA: hypothetical protein VJ521_15755, partial [Acidobacteriota bacterium]|nr:hypothetical protein [Acidobacteriota bacterium]
MNELIRTGKIYYEPEKNENVYHPQIQLANLDASERTFYEKSWLKEDVENFNSGNSDIFLIEKGRLKSINIYRHRTASPLASDWSWSGRIYSQSSQGYAYLWNSRRTLKLFRPSLEERASAKIGQSEFRDVVYGRGHLFQTGLGITLRGRYNNRIADIYSLGDNIILKSFVPEACFLDGHAVPKGMEQRLEEGDLVQIHFSKNEHEEFLFHDFSQKPLSFINVLNGRLLRANLDRSFHFIDPLADAIETTVRKTKTEKKLDFDIHLALDEDLSGLAQTSLENFVKQSTRKPARASCTILDAIKGSILATASVGKSRDDVNENFKLHPVGSATKVFLAAAATQNNPDLLDLEIDPHPAGEDTNLLGYPLQQGIKLRPHSPYPGDSGRTDFASYIAKSCNRYHAVLMFLSLAKDNVIATGIQNNLQHGIAFLDEPIDSSNGEVYLLDDIIRQKPDLQYFLDSRSRAGMQCSNLDSSELALNLERMFDVKRKYYEGSGDFFSADPWNLLLARLGLQQRPELYPIFYPVMPQTVNLGFNLNIDFRLDFISILFGGATNRWNNIKLAEAMSRLVTDRKVHARFVEKIAENGRESLEQFDAEPLNLNSAVHDRLLQGMEGVCIPGGTAADLYPMLVNL